MKIMTISASPTALSSTRRMAGVNICESALLKASIIAAQVIPAATFGKPAVYETGESVSSCTGTRGMLSVAA
jgi:hypothetical protein